MESYRGSAAGAAIPRPDTERVEAPPAARVGPAVIILVAVWIGLLAGFLIWA